MFLLFCIVNCNNVMHIISKFVILLLLLFLYVYKKFVTTTVAKY
jgi:hypothetical protein